VSKLGFTLARTAENSIPAVVVGADPHRRAPCKEKEKDKRDHRVSSFSSGPSQPEKTQVVATIPRFQAPVLQSWRDLQVRLHRLQLCSDPLQLGLQTEAIQHWIGYIRNTAMVGTGGLGHPNTAHLGGMIFRSPGGLPLLMPGETRTGHGPCPPMIDLDGAMMSRPPLPTSKSQSRGRAQVQVRVNRSWQRTPAVTPILHGQDEVNREVQDLMENH
jgi:hypothetical protein